MQVFAVNSVVGVFIDFPAVAERGNGTFFIALDPGDKQPLRILGFFRGNVDDAINGVGTPKRGARTANDFDTINVFEC